MAAPQTRTPLASSQPGMLRRWMAASIANRITFATLLLTAAYVLLIGGSSYGFTRSLIQRNVQDQLDAQADVAAQRLDSALNAILRDMNSLARNTLLTDAIVDAQKRSIFLQPFLRDHQLPVSVPFDLSLVDDQGTPVASHHRRSRRNFGSEPWFQGVVRRAAKHAEIADSGGTSRLLLAVPVIHGAGGAVKGALVLELPLSDLLARRIISPEGRVRQVALLRGNAQVVAQFGASGEEVIESTSLLRLGYPLSALNLSVRLRDPLEREHTTLDRLAAAYIGVGALMLVLALSIARYMSQRLTRPLSVLSERANDIAGGHRLDVTLPEAGGDEVGRLTGVLNKMLEGLRASHDTLEQQVADRTRELGHMRTRLQAVLDNVLEGIITIDEHGSIELFSRGSEHIFGYRAEDVLGHNVNVLMPEPYRSRHDHYIRSYLATGHAHIIGFGREVECLRRDGSIFPAELSIMETFIEGRRVFVGMVRDITERRRIDRMKNEFISTVSHELRTPLTSIHGALGLMAGGVTGPLSDTARQLVEVAHRNSERLLLLVNDILDMEKIATGRMHYEMAPCRVSTIIEQVVEANRAYAEKHRVSFAITGRLPGVSIRVDDTRCMQVLSNLLSNAAKFSQAGEEIEIGACRRDGAIRIQVADRGAGIPEEFHDKVFEKFSQADASDARQKGGTGLGLSISRALTEGMGGRIGFEPNVPHGTVFYVEFPEVQEPGRDAT